MTTINAYDGLSRLTAIDTLRNRTPVLHAGYTYDDAGNRLGKSLLEWSESYQYDALDRLKQVDRGAATTERYTYDKVGNRKTSLEFSDWTYNARNELGSYGARTLTYDENGNTKTSSEDGHTRVYEWNPENQLTRVTQDAAEVARFNYDPLGRRVEKVAGGATTTYVYDGDDILRRVSAGTTVRYVHGPGIDEPLALENGAGQLTFEHADALGSELKQTDGAGAVTFSRSYDAFGQLQTGATTAGYAYTGREWDAETGLYYYRARYYDPHLGRFISEDPIGFDSRDPNFYAYVKNNPVNLVDPTGLLGIDKKCAEMVAGKVTKGFGPGDNDKYKHCVVSCYIDVTCDYWTAVAAGIGKEIQDMFGPGNAEWADWQADREGIKCGENIKKNKKGTCEKPCRQKYP